MATANLLQTSVSGGTQNALSLQGDGVFFPKASTTSRLALTLTTTDKGFIVYDTTDNNIYFWNGAAWESVPSSGDAGANGSVQYNDNGIVSGATNFVWDKVNGRVGIGNNSPLSVLTVSTQVGARLSIRTSDSILGVVGGSGFDSLNDSASTLVPFVCRGSTVSLGTTAGVGVTLNSTNNLVLAGGTIGANGVGVTFPAVQVASSDANCLDDYEEGTWSPTPSGNVNLTSVVSVSARYTKVGRLVTLSGQVTATVTLPNIVTYFVLPSLPFANGTVTTGAVMENGNFTVGAIQVSASNLYGFFPVASAIVSGAATFYYSVTYTV